MKDETKIDEFIRDVTKVGSIPKSEVKRRLLGLMCDSVQSARKEGLVSTSKVNRVEVIDWTAENTKMARAFVKWQDDLTVSLQLQDAGRTLKIFLMNKHEAI